MKRSLTTLMVIAGLILLPLIPAVEASVTGTFTAQVTVPNVPATTIVFPALSGGAAASATTTITIPDLAGGVDGTAAVAATGTLSVTGTTGTTTSILVGSMQLLAASTSIAFDTDANTTASDIAAAINANTATSGYSAIASGATITITAPTSAGASVNGTTATFTSDYLGGATSFTGGVTGTAGVNATTTTSSFAAVTLNSGADLSLNIGSTTIALTGGDTGAQAAAAVAAAINADSSNPYTASVVSTDKVMLTAKASGTAGNAPAVATDLAYNAGASVSATTTSGHFAAVSSATTSDRTLNIGSTTIALTGGMTAAQAASTTAAAINADSSNPYTASVANTDEVMLTTKASGTASNGAVVASDLSYNATPEVVVFTPANVTAGETYRITINGTNYDATATASSTVGTIVVTLAPLADANAAVSCTQDGTAVTCTSSVPGASFTSSATVLAPTSVTISPITLTSNGTSASCAKAGDVVTLNFTSSQPLATSTSSVVINGATSTLVSLGSNQYKATFTTNASTTPGYFTFMINATDTNSNSSTATTTTNSSAVRFYAGVPTVTLNGSSTVTLANGATYNEQGATSTDAFGNSLTVSTTGSVNTAIAGDYVITYAATDCAGDIATTTRTVTVQPAPAPSGGHSGGSSSSNGIGSIVSAVAQLLAPETTGPAVPAVIQQVLGISTHRFTFHLKKGMSGDEILELQKKLAELGIYNGPITGYFGPLTLNAVVRFQKAHGVPHTGFVGDLTISVLNRM